MITVMTHMDADGVISLSLFLKKIGGAKVRAYFTSPVQLRDTICRSASGKRSLGELYIFDIAGENRAIYAAAMYDMVVWIDHHEWSPEVSLPHVKIHIDSKAKSAAKVVAEFFGISSKLVDIANQIDTNDVKDEIAENIRTIIGALRWKYSGRELNIKLYKLAEELMNEDFKNLAQYNDMIKEYGAWLDNLKKRVEKEIKIFKVKDLKVAVFEALESVPVYIISNMLSNDPRGPFDIILVLIYRAGKYNPATKMEFRTHTDVDVLKIAKFYGGGGHRKASGVTVNDIVTVPEILNAIELLYS
ncbi:hypothetical protein ABOONEI_2392 [Aciduliprofundum boonei T469]|nr:hypothetical protein ABOONEI_2392 [Aciduliprofundum boonei T469]